MSKLSEAVINAMRGIDDITYSLFLRCACNQCRDNSYIFNIYVVSPAYPYTPA